MNTPVLYIGSVLFMFSETNNNFLIYCKNNSNDCNSMDLLIWRPRKTTE